MPLSTSGESGVTVHLMIMLKSEETVTRTVETRCPNLPLENPPLVPAHPASIPAPGLGIYSLLAFAALSATISVCP